MQIGEFASFCNTEISVLRYYDKTGLLEPEYTDRFRKWNNSACAYEIISCDNDDYMIIEWKSGDYRYGGMDTDYYVFRRNK